MSINYAKRLAAKMPLNLNIVEKSWNWPPNAALEVAAGAFEQEDIDQINSDMQLFSRTRLKSCRLIKMLRDAQDAAWDIEHSETAAFPCEKVA